MHTTLPFKMSSSSPYHAEEAASPPKTSPSSSSRQGSPAGDRRQVTFFGDQGTPGLSHYNDLSSSFMSDGSDRERDPNDLLLLRQFEPAYDIQALLRFAGLGHEIENVQYPIFASTGELPQVVDDRFIMGRFSIVEYLRRVCSADGVFWEL
eukprot:gb/GECG01002783.1/.p1 GENE.gb/GECG01002783.1/~~gb/GECG01002783.1/.p1  ORF type:complete len:151 (+),score=13.55 gb/GECG01002783.1/:1-453(+)